MARGSSGSGGFGMAANAIVEQQAVTIVAVVTASQY